MTIVLTEPQRRRAQDFNQRVVAPHPHREAYIRELRRHVGLGEAGALDGDFAQALANWQEQHPNSVASRRFDGLLRPRTEAHLGIRLSEMENLARRAESYWRAGGVFYDSWGNDGRDNDSDGAVDEADEQTSDGAHWGRVYQGFGTGDGGRVVAPTNAQYQYQFCSDLVSNAVRDEGIVRGGFARAYQFGGGALDAVAYKFVRSSDYPERYMRGDIIGYNDRPESQGGHGGHVGIVIQDDATGGGSIAPLVINLPGPSHLTSPAAASYYRANGEHADGRPAGVRGDIVREQWPADRLDVDRIPARHQFLIRLVCTRLHRGGRRPSLPRARAR
ncbi:MAG: hypothetical protein K8H88_12375 [Sandaracinaceae bacterium]|nr:hypothetical protein [Sandaracinaceae bacterium]